MGNSGHKPHLQGPGNLGQAPPKNRAWLYLEDHPSQ